MKTLKSLLACAFVMGMVASGLAQLQSKPSSGQTAFAEQKTSVAGTSATPEGTVTPTSGTYTLKLNITVVSTIATATKITCLAQIAVAGDTLLSGIQQTTAVAATRTGNTATCTVEIPYSWALASPSEDKLERVYSILAPVEATPGTTVPFHSAHLNLGEIDMPANGATTTETVAATL